MERSYTEWNMQWLELLHIPTALNIELLSLSTNKTKNFKPYSFFFRGDCNSTRAFQARCCCLTCQVWLKNQIRSCKHT